ncbi:hypothetical protein VTK56DRAFT_9752 [Thermocarpiscus australiensis]
MTVLKRPTASESDDLTHLEPIPSYEESIAAPRPAADARPRLQILGATWGGVNVTHEVQSMVDEDDQLLVDMRTLWTVLTPDPAPRVTKVLTVVYQFFDDDDDSEPVRLLVLPEHDKLSQFAISKKSASEPVEAPSRVHSKLDRVFRSGPSCQVEILAAVYGPQRIESPSVLLELERFLEGRRGQIRMTNGFFKTDPWPYRRKTWSVYFRFVNSKRIQVVTGWEDGALEVPWSRH